MKLLKVNASKFCKMLVEVILRGATPTGFPVRIAAPCSGPKFFRLVALVKFIETYVPFVSDSGR